MLGLAVWFKAEQFTFIEQLQFKVFDMYQRHYPREYQPAPVKIVDIDEESLAKLGQWPWPRQVVAQLVMKLIEYNASVVAFDIVFATVGT